MKLRFEFTIHDWMAFQHQYLQGSKEAKKSKYFMMASLPVCFLVLSIIQVVTQMFHPELFLAYVLVSALWLLFAPMLFDRHVMKMTKKMIEEGDNKGILGTHEVEMTEDHLRTKEPGSESSIIWSVVSKVEETPEFFFLYNTAISAVVIPKAEITAEEVIGVREFLLKKGFQL